MGWMDGAAGSLWAVLVVTCLLLAVLVVAASVSLLRRPAQTARPDRHRLERDLAAGRITPQEYESQLAARDSRQRSA